MKTAKTGTAAVFMKTVPYLYEERFGTNMLIGENTLSKAYQGKADHGKRLGWLTQ